MSNGVEFRKLALDLRGQLTDAQSELSALREDLDKAVDMIRQSRERNTKLRKRLTAAEQRNADLVELLEENQWRWQPYDDHDHTDAGYYCIQCYQRDKVGHAVDCKLAAYLKPTESGASEKSDYLQSCEAADRALKGASE